MCLAIPARITVISGFLADVHVDGVSRTVSVLLTPDAEVGDYIHIHTGYAISVVDESEALESLRLLQELAETYPVDELYYSTGNTPLPSGGVPGS